MVAGTMAATQFDPTIHQRRWRGSLSNNTTARVSMSAYRIGADVMEGQLFVD